MQINLMDVTGTYSYAQINNKLPFETPTPYFF